MNIGLEVLKKHLSEMSTASITGAISFLEDELHSRKSNEKPVWKYIDSGILAEVITKVLIEDLINARKKGESPEAPDAIIGGVLQAIIIMMRGPQSEATLRKILVLLGLPYRVMVPGLDLAEGKRPSSAFPKDEQGE